MDCSKLNGILSEKQGSIFRKTQKHMQSLETKISQVLALSQGCQTHFHRGHISLEAAFRGPHVILGLYKCNYSLTRGKELYIRPFESNHEADVAPGENEFETPALNYMSFQIT